MHGVCSVYVDRTHLTCYLCREGRVVLRAVLHEQFFDRCVLAKRWRDEHHITGARAMQILVLDPGERMPR